MRIPTIEQDVQAYTEKVEARRIECSLSTCPRCSASPGEFTLHDVRKRTFLYVVERLIKKVDSLLPRWKCPLCGETFTDYPPFAVRYKRYVKHAMMEYCGSYLENERATYENGVCKHGMPIFHDCDDPGERGLAPSTLYRWITWFGGLEETLRKALGLLGKLDSGILRKVFPVPSRKYRSPPRRTLLEDARKLFAVEVEYRSLFGVSIFPRLAIGCGWG